MTDNGQPAEGNTLDGKTVAGTITGPERGRRDCRECPFGAAFDFWNEPGEDLYESPEE